MDLKVISRLQESESWNLFVADFARDIALFASTLASKVDELGIPGIENDIEDAMRLSRAFESRTDDLSEYLKPAVLAFVSAVERERDAA